MAIPDPNTNSFLNKLPKKIITSTIAYNVLYNEPEIELPRTATKVWMLCNYCVSLCKWELLCDSMFVVVVTSN